MASRNLLALFFLLLCCCVVSPCAQARKLLSEGNAPSLEADLFLSALPKGKVPASGPSKKGHAMVVDQKLLSMHFAKIDRILKSVPSPGVGH
ncbi:hypothetical protein H6P81_014310 [Aristolochia fimbriata]|uniref:Precursor of CEP14 n=1 Tax=Aristolochia fimbriata TaxID=158543 RepID=A0AAV7EKS9_ARIFI|nr:hypothetical protein H6P81_014310 [Aristolochia fimbriata]